MVNRWSIFVVCVQNEASFRPRDFLRCGGGPRAERLSVACTGSFADFQTTAGAATTTAQHAACTATGDIGGT